jgi:hypothetical protein
MSKFAEKAERYRLSIHEILLNEWDPIGVSHIPEAQDEYDAYVDKVYQLLLRRASSQEIFDYLSWLETQHMCLDGNLEHTEQIAEKLANLVAKIEAA